MTSRDDWPDDIPDRKIFVDAYYVKRNLTEVSDKAISTHLSWIIRFYHGTTLYPNGWNRVSGLFLSSMESEPEREKMVERLERLGIDIANEWAQDNEYRNINSSNMIAWGSALRTAAERNDHDNFVTRVEADVAALIAREVTPKEISYERYYPVEDYDNF